MMSGLMHEVTASNELIMEIPPDFAGGKIVITGQHKGQKRLRLNIKAPESVTCKVNKNRYDKQHADDQIQPMAAGD